MINLALTALSTSLELFAAALIFLGGIEAFYGTVKGLVTDRSDYWKRKVWQQFATWIVLSLEFALGADIVATIRSPSWNELGQLALLALVRTVLNFFLVKDLEDFSQPLHPASTNAAQ